MFTIPFHSTIVVLLKKFCPNIFKRYLGDYLKVLDRDRRKTMKR